MTGSSNKSADAVLAEAIMISPARHGNLVVGGKQEVRKHVAAIHTSGELGLVERKLVNVLLLNAYDQLKTVRQHKIPTKMLMAMLGWPESEDTSHLKKALTRIVSTPVEFNLMDNDEAPSSGKAKRPAWSVSALLAQGDLIDGHCVYEYSSRLADELSDPAVYAIINVGIQRQFKGGYALTLYENCVRYRRTGSTGIIPLDRFRRLMGATSPTYDDFRRLSDLVLKKAIEEVNGVSDIKVTPTYIREGRKVASIKFTVEEKAQQTIFSENENMIEEAKKSETFARLLRHNIGEKLAIAWIISDEQRAKSACDIAEHRARNNLIKSSTSGYIKKLIDDRSIDLSQSTFEKELEEERNRKKTSEEAAEAVKRSAVAEGDARSDKISALVKALTDEEKLAYSNTYVDGDGAAQSTSYDRHSGKFKNTSERIAFMTWMRKKVAEKHGIA